MLDASIEKADSWFMASSCRRRRRAMAVTPAWRHRRSPNKRLAQFLAEELHLVLHLEGRAALVAVVGPDADVLFGGVVVVGGEDGGWGADGVHEGRGEEGRGLRAGGEVDTVEVGEGCEDILHLVAVDGEIAADLLVGVGVGDFG